MLAAILLALPLTVLAQAMPGISPAPAAGPGYDVFANVLSDVARRTIGRDARCGDAKTATDAYVASKGQDLKTGLNAMVGLEKCAEMDRVGDWVDYRDYLITAASAIAYEIGIVANEPKALARAVQDAAQVTGYEAPQSESRSMVMPNSPGLPESNGQREMDQMGSANANINNHTVTRHYAGYSGPYGRAATDIAAAAEAALRTETRK